MLRVLSSFWWRNKERFIILLLGVFIVSSGLSVLSGLTESNKGTVIDTLENKWQVSYHILVRPPGTSLTDEQNGLIEPNLPGGISGGITMKQFQQIKQMPEVEAAAPLAVVGYGDLWVDLNDEAKLQDDGVYRVTIKVTANNGVETQTTDRISHYITSGSWHKDNTYEYGIYGINGLNEGLLDHYAMDNALVVGIDPAEESRLVGLDKAIVPLPATSSRYFETEDQSKVEALDSLFYGGHRIVFAPALISSQILANKTYTYTYERLELPFDTAEQAEATMEKVKANGGEAYLAGVRGISSESYTYNSEQGAAELFKGLPENLQMMGVHITEKPSPLKFNSIASPYAERWPYAFGLQTYPEAVKPLSWGTFPEFYRQYQPYSDPDYPDAYGITFDPTVIGMYDPSKLEITKDIDNLFPMDTYSTPAVKSVLDSDGQPVNPPASLSSINNPLGFVTSPPTMLTTLDAAAIMLGDQPISVIRVKVAGIEGITEANRQKLETIASQIHEQTGLQADVTFASSPQPVLIQVPPSGTQTRLGWIEQQWIKLGTAFTLVSEVKVGFSGMLLLVMFVAVIYVLVTNLISFLVRKQQFAVLLSIGWRYSALRRLIITEAALIGCFVALVTWSIEGYLIFERDSSMSLLQFFAMGGCGFLIYMLGAIAPLLLLNKISPLESLHTGETSATARRLAPVRNLFQLALAHFGGKLKRNLLSVLSMTVPAVLMMFFLFVTFRLQGTFYTSWLGQYAAAEIGPLHYTAAVICLMISILTIAEIMWQNVSERSEEISLLKALGWRKNAIRVLILWEGAIAGVLAGVLTCILGTLFITVLYRQFPGTGLWTALPAAVIPLFAAIAGSMVPAELGASRGLKKGLAGKSSSSRLTARLFQSGLAVVLLLLIVFTGVTARHITDEAREELAVAALAEPGNAASALAGGQQVGDLSGFTPEFVRNDDEAVYDLNLQMNEQGRFSVTANLKVTNTSSDTWDRLEFYMIPNVFTLKDQADIYRKDAAFSVKQVEVGGSKAAYKLERDSLSVSLPEGLAPAGQTEVIVTYTFTVPKQGIRFSQIGGSYDLAQWYPMLATYEGGWNKAPYVLGTESFVTDFSDFTLHYDLPEGYRIISSSDDDPKKVTPAGEIKADGVKELMVSIAGDLTPIRQKAGNVELNIWSGPEDQVQLQDIMDQAAAALEFFNDKIGTYPHKQLDIILGDRMSMEYPGVVTVYSKGETADIVHAVVHEIAHQWFYGVVNSDQYHDGWLDEGMTELATSLFLDDYAYSEQRKEARGFSNRSLSELSIRESVSMLYAQPVLKFRELFDQQATDGIEFLQAYFKTFQYKQVDTKGFVSFVKAYFHMTDDSFFDGWVKL